MENMKWARRISRDLVSEVLSCDEVREVIFKINRKEGVTTCNLLTNTNTYKGVAICSILDNFDEVKGKNKALGRALAAYKKQTNSMEVRRFWEDFPKSWTMRQVERVATSGVSYKSAVM